MTAQPDIKRFSDKGAALDQGHIIKKQFYVEKRIKEKMYRSGYVPVLDITPVYSWEYNQDKEVFLYEITMYGVKTDDIEQYEGWLSGQWIKCSLTTRLERFSHLSESM